MKYIASWSGDFNPRSHKGSDRFSPGSLPRAFLDFNPRSHKGSDGKAGLVSGEENTNFNPRSHKGSDDKGDINVSVSGKFQSTLPQGERQNQGGNMTKEQIISIHAPTRGATAGRLLLPKQLGFQSTLPQGERLG